MLARRDQWERGPLPLKVGLLPTLGHVSFVQLSLENHKGRRYLEMFSCMSLPLISTGFGNLNTYKNLCVKPQS